MEFIYQARNKEGQMVEGKIEAPSEDTAVNFLHQKELVVLSLDLAQAGLFEVDISHLFEKPNRKDVVIFTRQLATLIDADVPLVDGLRTIGRQTEKVSFQKVVNTIASSIEGGASLSVAVSEFNDIFSNFYVSLVRAGEVSGKLQETLSYLADYLERSATLTSKIRGALSYPAFVLFGLTVVTIIMMTTVLPQLLAILEEAGVQDLPLTTRVIIATTSFFNQFILIILFFLVIAGIALYNYIKTAEGKEWLDNIKIKVPKLGSIVKNFYLARFAETLSTLIKAGVPILSALEVTSDVMGNVIYKDYLLEARDNVKSGGTISEVLQKYKEFPALVTSMLSIGERTGRTDFMLENIFKFYKNETENSLQNISQLLEPVLIMILGIAVGLLVSGILLPIYSLVGTS
ncbi:MAG: type II secretion system F family protein [bacterium]|nr:type II secretion system F family protein [bacterium]